MRNPAQQRHESVSSPAAFLARAGLAFEPLQSRYEICFLKIVSCDARNCVFLNSHVRRSVDKIMNWSTSGWCSIGSDFVGIQTFLYHSGQRIISVNQPKSEQVNCLQTAYFTGKSKVYTYIAARYCSFPSVNDYH